MKPVLIILSDLWGKEKSDWIQFYTRHLSAIYEISFYDSCTLAGVDKSVYQENRLHEQFVNGGISKAVENLINEEHKIVDVLAFSVGGVIAWKTALKKECVRDIFALSSTRLRVEVEKPDCYIRLFYGEKDRYQPRSNWFERLEIKNNIIPNALHEMYRDKSVAEIICKEISAYRKGAMTKLD
ncbi:alpha/beta hydrolase [Marinifilum breve]|uniref:Alpha/beta hydrolase n=1 Tax=Marinifilum breve TaxID=2184082 RepID=A0A2V4A2F6_9BACT|nr:alpha/beta hydrolase [Marinifilum breve]PXY03085.1 alpha/beta hydrolase [Marinifilum breve]